MFRNDLNSFLKFSLSSVLTCVWEAEGWGGFVGARILVCVHSTPCTRARMQCRLSCNVAFDSLFSRSSGEYRCATIEDQSNV